jgi:molybdopterin molybdotransferase
MTLKLADDCFFYDKDRLPHGDALAILKSRVRPVVEMEEVRLDNAAGRYLAEAVVAPRPIPAHDNAAVDGYSFAYASYDKAQGMRFKVSGEASAGHPYAAVPPPDGTVRIFTGAVMPSGHDTVAMQEFVDVEERDGEWFATIQGGLKHGANRRLAGEDSEEGNVLVKPGTRGFE